MPQALHELPLSAFVACTLSLIQGQRAKLDLDGQLLLSNSQHCMIGQGLIAGTFNEQISKKSDQVCSTFIMSSSLAYQSHGILSASIAITEALDVQRSPVVGIKASILAADAPQMLQISKHDFWPPCAASIPSITPRFCCRVIAQQTDENV